MNPTQQPETPLQSWKEIGAYLQRDATTARRWEKEEGLPVHRLTHKARSSVYAYPSELDAWRESRKALPAPPSPRPLWKMPAFAVTMAMCLVMVGNGLRPQRVEAQTPQVARQVGGKADGTGHVSLDGRYLSTVDWDTGDLALEDLASNQMRRVTNNGSWNGDYAEESTISKDGKRIAYSWWNDKNRRYELRVIDQGGAAANPSTLYDNPEYPWIGPSDWSPDGRWIAVNLETKGSVLQIGLVDAQNGSMRILKSRVPRPSPSLSFSKDGRYLAYDLSPTEPAAQRDLYLFDLAGNREVAVVAHSANDVLMGWSPDGTRLVFTSDRTGSVGLWSQRIANGTAQGSPELLRPDFGNSDSLGLTDAGTLYFYKRYSSVDVTVAPVDLKAGRLSGPPVSFRQGFLPGGSNPTWSPDGKNIVYHFNCDNGCIAIRSVETGELRRVAPNLTRARYVKWSPDGRSLLTNGADEQGRAGIFRVDVRSGQATTVILAKALTTFVGWSPDSKKVYFQRDRVFVERDLKSGKERNVYNDPAIRNGSISPDSRSLALVHPDPATKTVSLLLVPVAGGEPRELLRVHEPGKLAAVNQWTPDSGSVIVRKHTGSSDELWLFSTTGGEPRKLDIDPAIWTEAEAGEFGSQGFSLSPDGNRIAFQTGRRGSEIWALENFLPTSK
jgi:Tol biopolymer transport system component